MHRDLLSVFKFRLSALQLSDFDPLFASFFSLLLLSLLEPLDLPFLTVFSFLPDSVPLLWRCGQLSLLPLEDDVELLLLTLLDNAVTFSLDEDFEVVLPGRSNQIVTE